MTPEHDLVDRLRGLFAADERELPDPVRIAVTAAVVTTPQRRGRWRLPWAPGSLLGRRPAAATAGLLFVLLTLLALLALALLVPLAGSSPAPASIVNGWIAFSSQPHEAQVVATDIRRGGDIYLAHDRHDLRMLVSRGPQEDSNVCPAFSPDGRRLAYGERTSRPDPDGTTSAGGSSAIVILDLAIDGSITRTSRLPIEPTLAEAPCPRWSADGTRIGSLEDDRRSVVVRDLDGSVVEQRDGDPTLKDFSGRGSHGPLLSPDGTKVLEMRDISGFDMQVIAVAVHEPFTEEVIAASVPVNGSRSWPGQRDASWQALTP